MQSDPVVVDIRNLREQRATRFAFDIQAIVKDAQQRDAAGDRKIVRRPARRPLLSTQLDAEAITNR